MKILITLVSLLISSCGWLLVRWADPYFEMNPSNLNTMNSYIVPTQVDIDPQDYDSMQYRIQFQSGQLVLINNFDWSLDGGIEDGLRFHWMSTYNGTIVLIILLILLWIFFSKNERSGLRILFSSLFEGVWDMFESLLWEEAPLWIKKYVVYSFFVILFANLLWVFNDILRFIVPWWLRNVTNPTGEFEFNIALALIATIIPLYLQFKKMGAWGFFHEYIPITGKWLIEWSWIWARLWDIAISLFTWFLDIVWVFSKVISLSMRLFGNMSAWWVLLNVTFLWLGWLFVWLLNMNLVIGIPVILYIQSIFVAFVQAFVFAMLSCIGIKLVIDD